MIPCPSFSRLFTPDMRSVRTWLQIPLGKLRGVVKKGFLPKPKNRLATARAHLLPRVCGGAASCQSLPHGKPAAALSARPHCACLSSRKAWDLFSHEGKGWEGGANKSVPEDRSQAALPAAAKPMSNPHTFPFPGKKSSGTLALAPQGHRSQSVCFKGLILPRRRHIRLWIVYILKTTTKKPLLYPNPNLL